MADLTYEEFATEFTSALMDAWTSPLGFTLVPPWSTRPSQRPYLRLTWTPTSQEIARRHCVVQNALLTAQIFPAQSEGAVGLIAQLSQANRAATLALDAAKDSPILLGTLTVLRTFEMTGSPQDDPDDGFPFTTTDALAMISTREEG